MAASHEELANSFGQVAEKYDVVRPGYPTEVITWLLPEGARTVLDLGAGTGKLTRVLATAGYEVVAVDPDEEMLGVLRRTLPAVVARQGSAEHIPLGDATVDAVLVAQAWHWVDPAIAGPEAARVLRPGGTLGLVWNVMDGSVPWVRRLGEAVSGKNKSERPREDIDSKAIFSAEFGPVESTIIPWEYELDRAGVLALVSSWSEYITADSEEQQRMLTDVGAVLDTEPELAGLARIRIPYSVRCFRAALA